MLPKKIRPQAHNLIVILIRTVLEEDAVACVQLHQADVTLDFLRIIRWSSRCFLHGQSLSSLCKRQVTNYDAFGNSRTGVRNLQNASLSKLLFQIINVPHRRIRIGTDNNDCLGNPFFQWFDEILQFSHLQNMPTILNLSVRQDCQNELNPAALIFIDR